MLENLEWYGVDLRSLHVIAPTAPMRDVPKEQDHTKSTRARMWYTLKQKKRKNQVQSGIWILDEHLPMLYFFVQIRSQTSNFCLQPTIWFWIRYKGSYKSIGGREVWDSASSVLNREEFFGFVNDNRESYKSICCDANDPAPLVVSAISLGGPVALQVGAEFEKNTRKFLKIKYRTHFFIYQCIF